MYLKIRNVQVKKYANADTYYVFFMDILLYLKYIAHIHVSEAVFKGSNALCRKL